MYLVALLVRTAWSLTLGIPFFLVGLVLFLVLDILLPSSDRGYRTLNLLYKIGSLGYFKGLRMEQDDFDVVVEKRRRD